ncbi:MAG: efflux RND transporter permease subunit, partial [Microcystaceae cyanobacterium]
MDVFIENIQKYMQAARQLPELNPRTVFTQFTFSAPLLEISIQRERANAQNVDISSIFQTLGVYLGSSYVNQFVLGGRLYQVYAQAENKFRSNPQDLSRLYVRSRDGTLVQLDNLVSVEPITYPPIVTHFNIYPA